MTLNANIMPDITRTINRKVVKSLYDSLTKDLTFADIPPKMKQKRLIYS